MKNLVFLIFIISSNLTISQERNELKISLIEVFYNFNKFGGTKDKYGSDIKNPEILYDIFFNIKIDGFDIDNPIDFNNFSLKFKD